MVQVPFFGIELPEPRLGHLIPDAIDTALRGTSKVLEHGRDLLDPPTPEDLARVQASFEATIPREFDRVRKRHDEGKIVNSEQLSSELEDASLDYYRRLMRTSVLGETDDEMEDMAAKKLGLRQPSHSAIVQQRHLQRELEARGGVDMGELMQYAAQKQAEREREEAMRKMLAERTDNIHKLRKDVRAGTYQAITTLTSVSGGALLGIFAFKACVKLLEKMLKKRGPKQPAGKRLPKASPRTTDAGMAPSAQQQRSTGKAAQQQTATPSKQQPQASSSAPKRVTKRR